MLRFALLLGSLLLAFEASARPSFFWQQGRSSHVLAQYLDFAGSDLDNSPGGEISGHRSLLSALYRPATGRWSVGATHEYNALDIGLEGAPARTNGDLHTLALSAGLSLEAGSGLLELSLAPAASASSNAVKSPGDLDDDALQWWGAAVWRQPDRDLGWVLGLARDYRFGAARTYPVAGLEWRKGEALLRLTYPDLLVQMFLTERWLLALTISPDGNEWQAYDRSLERHEEFRREGWQSDLGIHYRFSHKLRIGIVAGYHWNQEWRMRLEDDSLLRSSSGDSGFIGLQIGWFPGDP